MPKIPTNCTAVLGQRFGVEVRCGGPVVEAADPKHDAKCARCGAKYPKHHNYRKPKVRVDAGSGVPV